MLENRDRGADPSSPDPGVEAGGAALEGEPIRLSPMETDDLGEVADLEKVCFCDPWSRASFEGELRAAPTSWCRVLRAGERIAGYMVAWFIEDEAHLANIAVAPWARRQGCAQTMLDHLFREAYLRGSRVIVLEVRRGNGGAIALYDRNGFSVGGIRKNYYNNPREDALIMVRSLRVGEASA